MLAAIEDYPPHHYKQDGKIKGYNVEVARYIFEHLGIELEIRLMPWKRCLEKVKTGKASGLLSSSYVRERESFLYYPPEPTRLQRNVVFVRKSDQMKVVNLDDLKGLRVGVIDKYSYGPEFDNHQGLKKTLCREEEELVRILDMGRVNAAVAKEAVFLFIASERYGLKDKFEVAYVINEKPSYTPFSKTMGKKGRELADKFGKMLRQMREDGMLQKIMKKYR